MDVKMWIRSIVLFTATISAVNSITITIPCKCNDPKLSECLTNYANHMKPLLNTITPLGGVIRISRKIISKISKNYKLFPDRDLKVSLPDGLEVRGAGHFEIESLSSNPTGTEFSIVLLFKRLEINGTYCLTGTGHHGHIEGNGTMDLRLKNVRAEVTVQIERASNGKTEYMQVNNFTLRLTVDKPKLTLENLTDGGKPVPQKVVDEGVNKFIECCFDNAIDRNIPKIIKAVNKYLRKSHIVFTLQE